MDRSDFFSNQATARELLSQEQQAAADQRDYRKNWWKRGLGKGAVGAVTGAVTGFLQGGPAGALAGAGGGLAGGFGGEAINHVAFKDQHPEIAGNIAALAALGGGAAASKLAASKITPMGNVVEKPEQTEVFKPSEPYAQEMAKAKQFNPNGVAMPKSGPVGETPGMAPNNPDIPAARPPGNYGSGRYQPKDPSTYNIKPDELTPEQQMYLRLYGRVPGMMA